MGRQIIEIVQVLVDRIEKNGYQQRAREENAFDLNKRLTDAEGWVAHWKQARQEAHEAGELMKAEIETLKDEIKTLKVESSGLDQTAWYAEQDLEKAKAEIETLRQQLADAQRAVSDAFAEVNSVREQLDAAQAAVTLQRAGIERLQAFVDLSRRNLGPSISYADVDMLRSALAELDAGTEPTPVTEPLDAEVERLRAFVEIMRGLLTAEYADQRIIAAAIAKLDDAGNSSVTLTSSPTPVAEPFDAEGGACPDK